MSEYRTPYVGEGADGAKRSAAIDREEADTHPNGGREWKRCMRSAHAWDEQAAELAQSGGQ